jgi:hypothetical protein
MTTQDRAIELTKLNLNAIFGEKNVQKRLSAISSLWVPSSEVLFVDATGVFKSHEAISGMVDMIQSLGGEEDEFVELGEEMAKNYVGKKVMLIMFIGFVECLKHDEEGDVWVTRLKWGVGSKREKLGLTGWDVLTIVGGKIKTCYTFLDPQ